MSNFYSVVLQDVNEILQDSTVLSHTKTMIRQYIPKSIHAIWMNNYISNRLTIENILKINNDPRIVDIEVDETMNDIIRQNMNENKRNARDQFRELTSSNRRV